MIVIRYEGPKGGPGMPEMLTPTSAIMGAGLGDDVALHHRRPLLRRLARLHRRPRHARGAGRRPDRAGRRTATGSRSTPSANRSTSTSPTTSSPAAAPPGTPRRYKATRGTLYKYIKNVKTRLAKAA